MAFTVISWCFMNFGNHISFWAVPSSQRRCCMFMELNSTRWISLSKNSDLALLFYNHYIWTGDYVQGNCQYHLILIHHVFSPSWTCDSLIDHKRLTESGQWPVHPELSGLVRSFSTSLFKLIWRVLHECSH